MHGHDLVPFREYEKTLGRAKKNASFLTALKAAKQSFEKARDTQGWWRRRSGGGADAAAAAVEGGGGWASAAWRAGCSRRRSGCRSPIFERKSIDVNDLVVGVRGVVPACRRCCSTRR